ncbi:glycosyl transferase family 25 [Brucella endophytica]|uniref:Glycosyl transferase family 25 n=1 Tax=Brucella endophytica TaxID=1963359 RepID=A0A916SMT9_9HYPH|nr:glycosyltransferase family 25 protein [Brucella endophytica]GGB08293.1 glycosyl transferase family 25 [Brucella endophytica]
MPIPVYVINLDRSHERLKAVQASAARFGIAIRRVPAVDGSTLPQSALRDFDAAGFRRYHGKNAMLAEIGCYFSHLRVLEAIVEAHDAHAVIVEDDIEFTADFLPFIEELPRLSGWDAVKLVSHRTVLFRRFWRAGSGYSIGRCGHGPLGSSAAYVVSREGVKKMLAALKPMRLPYDVALERGWSGGYAIFTTDRPLVALSGQAVSTIAGRAAYASAKLPPWKRIGTLMFRASDYLRRLRFACAPNRLLGRWE